MAKVEIEGFETQEYEGLDGDVDETAKKISVINQIVETAVRDNPAGGFQVKFEGSKMRLVYHCYEMDLPTRLPRVEDESRRQLDNLVKLIKKEFKSRTGTALDLSEDKNLRSHSVEKVSLNSRYYYRAMRFYEIA